MSIEDAIVQLEIDATNLTGRLASEQGGTALCELLLKKLSAIDMAISALQAQQTKDNNAHTTNADHIRSLSNEELASVFAKISESCNGAVLPCAKYCFDAGGCKEAFMAWLNAECNEMD